MASSHVNIATMLTKFLLFVCIISFSFAKHESLDEGAPLDVKGLLIKLEKRISNSRSKINPHQFDKSDSGETNSVLTGGDMETGNIETSYSKPSDGSRNGDSLNQLTCQLSVVKGSIIKASASITAGAKYVDSLNGTTSNSVCQQHCCDNINCDIAVYQNKGDRFCYLFNCGGKCLFKDHTGYLVNTITHTETMSRSNTNNGGGEMATETDLQRLHQNSASNSRSESNDQSQESSEENSSNADESNQQSNQGVVISQHSVSLLGYCTQRSQCEDTNAACHNNNCQCQPGFYAKDGICRLVCSKSYFECYKLGTINRGPECVPHSQVCDSYMQCADGSDEFNCDAGDSPGSVKESSSLLNKGENSKVSSSGDKSSDRKHSFSHHGQTAHNTDYASETKSKSSDISGKEEKDDVASRKTSNSQSRPDSAMEVDNTTMRTNGVTTSKPTKHPSGGSDESPKRVYVSSREKLIIASPGGGNAEGPIVVLSLGLALTMILVIMLACRLRGVRHRLRKGRPLSQNEADYLINGMYL